MMRHDELKHKIIVILGTGRSGTSIIMQLLHGLGMSVSANLISSSVANPEGPYEDTEIFQLQSDLIGDLGTSVTVPMPDDWLKEKPSFRAIGTLEKLITSRLDESESIFGFKDPKTSMLLPLWVRVFNKLKITPVYILAVRDPGSTISSYLRQYNQPAEMAELVWLVRMTEALANTAADCFIAHYEDWFSDPNLLISKLLRYTGLDQIFKGDLSEVLANVVKSNLNRASMTEYIVQNAYVLKLYAALKECHGEDFDRQSLMTVVKECRHVMDGFKGWYQLVHRTNKKLADTQTRLEQVKTEAAKVKDLESRIRVLEQQKMRQDQLGTHIQKLERQLEHLLMLKH